MMFQFRHRWHTPCIIPLGCSSAYIPAEPSLTEKGLMLLKYSNEDDLAGADASSNADRQPFLIGVSPEIQALQKLIVEIAPTDIPVLLEGESGVGKEVAALEIHGLSRYRELSFVKLGCSAFLP